jgi:hypothetical protein
MLVQEAEEVVITSLSEPPLHLCSVAGVELPVRRRKRQEAARFLSMRSGLL